MTEVSGGDSNNNVPLFISTAVRHIQDFGPGASSVVTDSLACLAPTIDGVTGKCVRILDNLILSALKSGVIEDVFVLGQGGFVGTALRNNLESLKARRKRLFGKARLKYIEILSTNCRSETDELQLAIDQEVGSALISGGFIWTHALVVPPTDWSKFVSSSRSTVKKDSLGIAVFYPELCLSLYDGNAIGCKQQLIVLNQKTGELLKRTRMNIYQRKPINVTEDLALTGKFANPPEDIEIRTNIQSFSMFYGNGTSFFKFIQDNFDYASLEGVVDDILNAENSLESFYVYRDPDQAKESDWTRRPGTCLKSFRTLYNYLKEDACRYTDQMALEGERSYWKYDESRHNVYHESYMGVIENMDIHRSLVFQNVKLDRTRSISDSILCYGSTPTGQDICGLVVCTNNVKAASSGAVPNKYGFLMSAENGFMECNHVEFKYDLLPCFHEENRRIEIDEYRKKLQENDFRKSDDILDKLYGDHSGASDRSDVDSQEENLNEFSSEVQSMILSVIDNPEHMTNIIMELRTYRLAEFKSDHDVLRAAVPVLLTHLMNGSKLPCSTELQTRIAVSKIGDLFQSFCGNLDDTVLAKDGHHILYDEIAKFVSNGKRELFPRLCTAFADYSDHLAYLPEWVELNKSKYPNVLVDSPVLNQYLNWLAEDDDDEDSESE